MFIFRNKYCQIISALVTLLKRPYIKNIVENPDGSVLLQVVKGDRTYNFLAREEDKGMLQ